MTPTSSWGAGSRRLQERSGEDRPRQRDAIVERFAALLEEKNFALQKEAESPDFRRSFVAIVNGIIGRPVVTDVLIYGLYSKDFG